MLRSIYGSEGEGEGGLNPPVEPLTVKENIDLRYRHYYTGQQVPGTRTRDTNTFIGAKFS